jgi:hypothetical protein
LSLEEAFLGWVVAHGATDDQRGAIKNEVFDDILGSCRKSRKSAMRKSGRKSRPTPMATSHQPSIGTNISGGNQNTVRLTSSWTGLRPKGLRPPNQIKTIPSE